jgi:hypothetical protein
VAKFYIVGYEHAGSDIIESDTDPRDRMLRGDHNGPYNSARGTFDTFDEALKALGCDIRCKECGFRIDSNYGGKEKMLERQLCFTCNYWLEALARYEPHRDNSAVDKVLQFFRVPSFHDKNMVVAGGAVYHIGRESTHRDDRGFGGRKFVIEFLDGRIITSTNLWGGGEIPKRWLNRFPDNAKFVNGEHWVTMADGTKCMGGGK